MYNICCDSFTFSFGTLSRLPSQIDYIYYIYIYMIYIDNIYIYIIYTYIIYAVTWWLLRCTP